MFQNGALLLVVDYGGGSMDRFRVRPPSGKLNDNEWHKVHISRRNREVAISFLFNFTIFLMKDMRATCCPFCKIICLLSEK